MMPNLSTYHDILADVFSYGSFELSNVTCDFSLFSIVTFQHDPGGGGGVE